MKIAMRLTLDGLVRAMRMKAHRLSEAVESGGYEETVTGSGIRRSALKRRNERRKGGRHERADA